MKILFEAGSKGGMEIIPHELSVYDIFSITVFIRLHSASRC